MDLSSLKVKKESYLNEELKEFFSDLILEVVLNSKYDTKLELALLFEHKSYPDKFVLIQIGYYIFSHYLKAIKNKKPLVLIIPIVYYHCRQKWRVPKLVKLFTEYGKSLTKYLPQFEYLFFSLNEIPKERLVHIRNAMLTVALVAQRSSSNQKELLEEIGRIINAIPVENLDWNFFELILVYFVGITDLRASEVIEIVEKLNTPIKEKAMTTLDRLVEKGKIEGRMEEKVEVVLKSFSNGLSISLISNITSLSEGEVEKILKEHLGKSRSVFNDVWVWFIG